MDKARLKIDKMFDYLDIKIKDDNSREYTLKENAPQEIKDFFPKWKSGIKNYRQQKIDIK